MKHFGILAAATAAIVPATSAQAASYLFTITGDYSASFELDSNPTPDDFGVGGGFTIWDVPGFPDALLGIADVTFYNSGIGGGLGIEDFFGGVTLLLTDGSQLYSGSEETPTLLTGTFALTEFQGPGTYTLVVRDLSAAVPEPGTWALMIGGFGLVGAGMRRKKTKVSYQHA